jgi:hypothetical protein
MRRQTATILLLLAGFFGVVVATNVDAQPKKAAAAKKKAAKKGKKGQAEPPAEETSGGDQAAGEGRGVLGADAGTGTPKGGKGGGPGVVEEKTEGDAGIKTYRFGAVEVEGRLKSPQVLYFMRRVRAEFAAGSSAIGRSCASCPTPTTPCVEVGGRARLPEARLAGNRPAPLGWAIRRYRYRHRHGCSGLRTGSCSRSAPGFGPAPGPAPVAARAYAHAPLPVVLRTAAVWGTTVLSTRQLTGGQSMLLGDREGSVVPKPDGAMIADAPIRAVANGWELDARGATGGVVSVRGRRENPAELARTGAPIPIVAGDFGLVQYGPAFSVFFQFAYAAPALKQRRRLDWPLILAFLFALISVLGGLALIWAITTPPAIPKPLELTSAAELAVQFNLKTEPPEEPPPTGRDQEEDKGKGVKDPGAKDKKDMGGGKKMRGAEGQLATGTRGQDRANG